MRRAVFGAGTVLLALALSAPAQPGRGPGRNYGRGNCWRVQANQDQTSPGAGMRAPRAAGPRMGGPQMGGRGLDRPGRPANGRQCPYRLQAQGQAAPAPAPDDSQKK